MEHFFLVRLHPLEDARRNANVGNPNDRKFQDDPHMGWRDNRRYYKRLTPEQRVRLIGFVGCGPKIAVGSSAWKRERV
jgi:hypothetical protein